MGLNWIGFDVILFLTRFNEQVPQDESMPFWFIGMACSLFRGININGANFI
jgi:hypothetical protein